MSNPLAQLETESNGSIDSPQIHGHGLSPSSQFKAFKCNAPLTKSREAPNFPSAFSGLSPMTSISSSNNGTTDTDSLASTGGGLVSPMRASSPTSSSVLSIRDYCQQARNHLVVGDTLIDLQEQRLRVKEEIQKKRAARLATDKRGCTLSGMEREHRKKAIRILVFEARRHQLHLRTNPQKRGSTTRPFPLPPQLTQPQPPISSLDLCDKKLFSVVINDLSILMREDAVLRKPRTGHSTPKGTVDNYFFVTTELSLLRLW